jgi:putative ABC transport system substrate-binding protein
VFWERLAELGYVGGRNLIIEQRWADGKVDRLPTLMAELVARKIDVLVTYGTDGAIAARNSTSTTPIVVATMGDPLGARLAASLARPGGNVTGLSQQAAGSITGKWLEPLQEIVPKVHSVAVISNPDSQWIAKITKELQAAGRQRDLRLQFLHVRDVRGLEDAFKTARRLSQALLVLPDPLTSTNRKDITALAAKHHLPSLYPLRHFVDAGGLIAYGPNITVQFRRAAEYMDLILKGAKPGDLPIEQPTKFELVVNLNTAKTLGLVIPESILLRADELIR